MSEYLFTGRNPDGKQVTECIEADCADAAVRHLTERGYQDIVLHTDDVGARYTHQKRVARHISPREYIRFRSMGRSGYFFFMLAKAYKASWLALLLAIALLAFRWQSGRPFGPVDMVALSIFVLPLLLALIAAVVRYGGRYERLVEAASWARWQEVLRLLPGLPAGISADEKAFRKATALAGLGRLDQALEVIKPPGTANEAPAGLYWTRLSGVYAAARDREQAFACMEKAASLAPDNATVQVDWALTLLRRKGDVARAEEVVKRVKTHALSDIVLHFLHFAEGILAFEKGKPYEARELLQQALAGLNSLTNPVAARVGDIMHAYLCLAQAAVGNFDSAHRHLDQATPRLQALGEDILLARCQAALGC